MSEVNPYAVLLEKAKALPPNKRMFMSAHYRYKTTDTERACGCLFGQLCPKGEGDSWSAPVSVPLRVNEVPYFKRWLAKAGLPVTSAHLAERFNDAYRFQANTEEVCKERYEKVIEWLAEQAAKWEATPEFDAGGLT